MTLPAVAEPLLHIRESLDRHVAAIGGRIGDHLASAIGRPGKMLRARFGLSLGAALGVDGQVCERLGCAAELVHNASLLQDDCIDRASVRRGAPTPNAQFGDRTAVMLGDLAFAEGMSEAARVSPRVTEGLIRTVREMAVGELQEEFLSGSLNLSVEGYCGIAARKTGALFEWMGEALSGESRLAHRREDPPKLGRLTGVILQVIDDIHDFTLDAEVAGKPPGQDFANGRLTLPGILALDDEASRPRFTALWERRRAPESFPEALALLRERGHLDAAKETARGMLARFQPLVEALPVSAEARRLQEFLDQMLRREF